MLSEEEKATRSVRLGDEGIDADGSFVRLRELALGLLDGGEHALAGAGVLADVLEAAVLLLGLLEEHLGHVVVEVLTAQARVTARRNHLKHTLVDGQDGDIKRAAAQVEDENGDSLGRLGELVVEAVGKRGRRGLVDDAQHLEARNGTRGLEVKKK